MKSRASAQPTARESRPLAASVMDQWQQAGASFGWITIDVQGDWRFHREKPATGGHELTGT